MKTLFTEQDRYLIRRQKDFAIDLDLSADSFSDLSMYEDLSAPMSSYTQSLILGVGKSLKTQVQDPSPDDYLLPLEPPSKKNVIKVATLPSSGGSSSVSSHNSRAKISQVHLAPPSRTSSK